MNRLMAFCAGEGSEFAERFGRPWAHEGYTYATDGSIVVRVLKGPDDSPILGALPHLAALTFDHALLPPAMWIPVNGLLLGAERELTPVGIHTIATRYLRALAALPEARIAPEASLAHKPVRFKFAGGLGLVMPVDAAKPAG